LVGNSLAELRAKSVTKKLKVTADLLRKYSQVFPVGSAGIGYPAQLVARRKAHLKALDSFAVFSGLPREPGSENLWIMSGLRIFQEPAMIHLTGINQPKVILVLNPIGKEKEVLFISAKDPAKEFWDGVRFGYPKDMSQQGKMDLAELKLLTGINDIRNIDQFEAYFKSLVLASRKPFGYGFYHAYRPKTSSAGEAETVKTDLETKTDYNWVFKGRLEELARIALAKTKKTFEIRTLVETHFKLRLPLEPAQVKDVEIAVGYTHAAFRDTLAKLREFKNENQLSAHLEAGMKSRSPSGLSFPNIVASGKNATILHYLKNDEEIKPGSLVLLDFGVRHGTMHADISRTVPVSGTFNPLQALLYDIVLQAAKENQKNAKPGETIRNLNTKVWNFLEDQLQTRFFDRGGKAKRAYEHQPHGVSHLMGEQEHDGDPHRLYQDYPLQVGWQISNEPGLYGHFTLKLSGRLYSEWIGIRVEDDLLITKTGCRNLSEEIPRKIADLEALISGNPHG
jgi:Xaa-Pro aminopeptidase